MRAELKRRIEQKRRFRIRNKIKGTADRPRMSVRFTERNIYVQFIDDVEGKTLASASTRHKEQADRDKLVANKAENVWGMRAPPRKKGELLTPFAPRY